MSRTRLEPTVRRQTTLARLQQLNFNLFTKVGVIPLKKIVCELVRWIKINKYSLNKFAKLTVNLLI